MSRTSIPLRRSLLASLALMVGWILLLQACGGGGGGGGGGPSATTSYYAYVANAGDDVSAYRINAGNGMLTPIDADAATPGIQNYVAGDNPTSITVTPAGKFAYVANRLDNTVSAYRIAAATGMLTPIDADTVTPGIQNFAAGVVPLSVATIRVVH